MADIDKLEECVSDMLFGTNQSVPYDRLLQVVKAIAATLALLSDEQTYTNDEILNVVSRIQTKHDTTMGLGALFASEDFAPWLDSRKSEIDPYYWSRYKKQLAGKMSKDVVLKLDEITDKILDHLENPCKEGEWARRGLVVGEVQSGKTANYIGVMCKAADAGYKVIIVLGGLLNSLRNQTQRRIDSDFIGFCTKNKKNIGVGLADGKRRPISLTNSVTDFQKKIADSVQIDLNALNEPVVLVIKKNVTTLKNLHDWLLASNKNGLSQYPLLLIDDESDHASINTNKPDKDPTKINQGIRELLKIFPRNSYLGYTATPFANIFIDPDTETEMTDGEKYRDLFPRDFILSLDSPSNYISAERTFNGDLREKTLRTIDDNDSFLPIVHKKDFEPKDLPPSLKRAIQCFMLIKTIRELDGQQNEHHSMMINASRFTNVQESLKLLVMDYLKKFQTGIKNYAGLSEEDALKTCCYLRELKQTWELEFKGTQSTIKKCLFKWREIQHHLNESVSSISVISINNRSTNRLDYDDYPKGRSIIAIGGLGLSRGLTLEGLSVSYFLRNSIMYDTLLQMGRWFGYRHGYTDLCRIFMTENAMSWYSHISSSVEELREEFREMERIGLTPMEFGLKVRSHPTALIVTAKNKMRTASEFVCQIALDGRFVETSRLINDPQILEDNANVLKNAVKMASKEKTLTKDPLGLLWHHVPIGIMEDVVNSFKNAPDCLLTTKAPLLEYINWLKNEKGVNTCDILLRSSNGIGTFNCAGYSILPITRSLENQDLMEKRLAFIQRRVVSAGDEAAGLKKEHIEIIKNTYRGKNIPDVEFRKFKKENGYPPLLILVFVSVSASKRVTNASGGKLKRVRTGESVIVPAYGISFPGNPSKYRRPEKTVSYMVNKTWLKENPEWQNMYDDLEEDEE